MSNVGKSLLCAALCRVLRQDGYSCAPFKSQNMALNSGVTLDGLEMGRAQIMQAHAAGIEPDVRMNPILLKPSSDTGSQVIVNGEILGQYSARDYFATKKKLVPVILDAYESLARQVDIVVIEGAGSPAEINLRQDDIVNMGLAEMVDAPVLLAGDIDPGGVFAQLYGTVKLLSPGEQSRIKGLIINKFRGDPTLLDPGIEMLEEKLQIPVIGVLPYLQIDLEDEDSMSESLLRRNHTKPVDIAVIRLPKISNFTDMDPLTMHPLLGVRYVTGINELGSPDMIILPGTKSTLSDLRWLRESGLADRIIEAAGKGTYILGICGGFQMLGEMLSDPAGLEGEGCGAQVKGLGLLPVETVFQGGKVRRRVRGRIQEGFLAGETDSPGVHVYGYEIHMGRTVIHGQDDMQDEIMVGRGRIAGTYLHGLFDSGEAVDRLAEVLAGKNGIDDGGTPVYADSQSDDGRAAANRSNDRCPAAGRSNDRCPAANRSNDRCPAAGRSDDRWPAAGRSNDRWLAAGRTDDIRSIAGGWKTPDRGQVREQQFDALADAFRRHTDMERIYRILERRE